LLLNDSESSLNEEQREILMIVQASGQAMLSIIADILDLARVESGKVELCPMTFALRDCIESALDVVTAKAQSQGLDLFYLVTRRVPYLIHADQQRLTQILFNLLSNAVKFTLSGHVLVSVDLESTTTSGANGENQSLVLRFEVKDTGCGIPVHLQSRLFSAFSQVHKDAARNLGGTGLGLVIARELCRLMGGQMSMTSEEGKGSSFVFTICAPGSDVGRPEWLWPARQVSVTASLTDLQRARALIVHPNAAAGETLSQVIQTNWELPAVVLTSTKEAIRWLLSQPWLKMELLLVDYRALMMTSSFSRHKPLTLVSGVPSLLSLADTSTRFDDNASIELQSAVYHYRQQQQTASLESSNESSSQVSLVLLAPLLMQRLFRQSNLRFTADAVLVTPLKSAQLAQLLAKHSPTYRSLESSIMSTAPATLLSSSTTSAQELLRAESVEMTSESEAVPISPPTFVCDQTFAQSRPFSAILIVEDNTVNQKLLLRSLSRLGYHAPLISVADNGEQAVALVHEIVERSLPSSSDQSFAMIILMDCLLPRLDGWGASRMIRQSTCIPSTHQPYIIACTANAMQGDEQICIQAGMDDCQYFIVLISSLVFLRSFSLF